MGFKIRHAEHKDETRILYAMSSAMKDSPYYNKITFSPDRAKATLRGLIDSGKERALTLIAEDSDGRIVGIFLAMVSYTAFGLEPVATEVLWWVAPEARKTRLGFLLVTAFEMWGQKIGAKRLVLGSMNNEHSKSIEKYCTKHGFSHTETTYLKEL